MSDLFTALAPRRVVERGLLSSETSWTSPATTLFVDLTGFTPLTDRLAAFGSRGTEELSRLMRHFFGVATETVLEHGGDPVAFGGDALAVLFEGPPGPALEAASGAASEIGCLARQVSGSATLAGPVPLQTRIGIARGPVTTGVARANERCLSIHVGAGLDLAVAAEGTARPGHVVVHPSAREPDAGDGGPPSPSPTSVGPSLADLASPWLVDRLAGAGPWESHRRVTVAFVRFPAVDPGNVPRFLRSVAGLLGLVDDWEGEVVQVSGGDKGVVAMVVFGTPLTHADDPLRTVEAMLRLRTSQPSVAVGVASGPVFAALLGSRSRLFPMHSGLAVTTAARLMQAAGLGELLCDATTWDLAGGRLTQHGTPSERMLKGHRAGVRVHSVDGWRLGPPVLRAATLTPLIGRDREVARLEALLDDTKAGRGRNIVLTGEPGIGKTRLLQEVVERASTRGFRVAAVDVDNHPRGRPDSVWRDLLGGLLGVGEQARARDWQAALSSWLPEAGAQVEVLGPALGLVLGDPRTAGPAHAPALQVELAEGLAVRLLGAVARERPLVIVVDNVDHLEPAARRMLDAVTSRVPGSGVSAVLAQANGNGGDGEVVDLGALPVDEAGLLAADAWRQAGGGSAPPWLDREVARCAGGNPLYVRAVTWSLKERWEPGMPPPAEAPGSDASLATLLQERVDRLSGSERELVHLLSAARRPCQPEVVADASARLRDVAVVRAAAASLASIRLVELDHDDGGGRIRLAHDLLRESVHESLSHDERDRLHRALAIGLARRGGDPVEIAEHLRELDEPDLQRQWFPLAAAAARAVGNYPEAVRHLTEILPLLTGADRERTQVELLETLLVAGRARDVLGAEAEGAGEGDPGLVVRRTLALAEAAFVCSEFERSEAAARRAMQLTDGLDEARYQRAAELLVLATSEVGDTTGAVAVAEQMLDRALGAGDARAVTTARAALGVALLRADHPREAARHYREALGGARLGQDVVTQVHVLSDLAGCAFETADHGECARLLAEARRLADGIGYRRHLAFNLSNDAQLRAALGDPFAAACAEAAVRRSVELGDATAAANALHTWLTSTPRLAASADHWARLVRLDLRLGRRLAAALDRADLSVAAARAGMGELALDAAAAAEATARELGQPGIVPRARLGRLLASAAADKVSVQEFLTSLGELANEPGLSDVERAEIALERWRATRDDSDRRGAADLVLVAAGSEPSAVVRQWLAELGEVPPAVLDPLPPPVGIGVAESTPEQLDSAFALVEAALDVGQRSE